MALVDRVKGMLLTPAKEWRAVEPEAAKTGELFTGYVLPLAALPPIVLSLASVYLLALIVDALAPTFGATRSAMQALKLSVYSYTAVWVAGVFAILPGTSALTVLGLYSIYLLYLGLPIMIDPTPRSLPTRMRARVTRDIISA